MDLRGLGGSDTGFPSHTPDDTGRDIVTLLDELKLDRVVLVG
jgi:pimeloyl-ACP methyl ester carboxylesterase